jgi:putative transposase
MTSPGPLLHNTIYHIYNRGINRANIFIEERNYAHFLNLYTKYIDPIADSFAFCLLRNHFHILVRIKSEQEITELLQSGLNQLPQKTLVPSKQFSHFFNSYAKAINKAYGRTGSLFQHPFGRVPVTNPEQFYRVVSYIHQNPQKHKLVADFRSWKYSSYNMMLSDAPTRLHRDRVLEWFGGKTGYEILHNQHQLDEVENLFLEDDD